MSERKVYEIARLMSDKNNLEHDMEEALELVTGMFRDKYVRRLNDAFGKCRENCIKNPSKEVRLIHALKPFMPEESRGNLDQMAELMVMMETMNNIRSEASVLSAAEAKKNPPRREKNIMAAAVSDSMAGEDKSIHEDGIYEVDQNCMLQKKGAAPVNFMSILLAGMLLGDS